MKPFSDTELREVRTKVAEWGAHWHGAHHRLGGFLPRGLSRKEEWWGDTKLYAARIGQILDDLVRDASRP